MSLVLAENGFEYLVEIPTKLLPFRLADCPSYVQLKGRGFKEVEAGWLSGGSLHMLEMKAWYNEANGVNLWNNIPLDYNKYARESLAAKFVDVLYVLSQQRPLIDIRLCVAASIAAHVSNGQDFHVICLVKSASARDLIGLDTAVYHGLRQLFVRYNLDFTIPQSNVIVVGHDDFRNFAAAALGLTTTPRP